MGQSHGPRRGDARRLCQPLQRAGSRGQHCLSQLCGPSAGGDAEERWRLRTERGPGLLHPVS